MIKQGDDLLVDRYSGGPDSVALLHLLCDLRKEFRMHLEVAHLQHGIRGAEAEEDARFVAELAEKLGLPLHLKTVDLPRIRSAAGKGNLEELARVERYRFLPPWRGSVNSLRSLRLIRRMIKLETVLMWLLRGSGLKGLGGMPPLHELDEATSESGSRLFVVRPLLDVSRAEIEEYMNERHLTFRLDRRTKILVFAATGFG